MTDKPLLFLHAGLSKTGSTALQIYFAKHAAQLLEYGLYYPDMDKNIQTAIESKKSSGNAISLFTLCRKFGDGNRLAQQTEIWVERLIKESKQFSFNAVLLSSETLCTLTKEKWIILENVFSKYFNLRLVVFYREPYDWVFSSWLQGVKMHGVSRWLGEKDPKNTWFPLFFPEKVVSHQLLIKTIRLCYEECKLDLVGSFFKGIGYSAPYLDDNQNEITNRSLTNQELTMMLLINRLTNEDRSFCEYIHDRLINQTTRNVPCYFYSPSVDKAIDEFFSANGLNRPSPCDQRNPVVESEKQWMSTQSIDAALMSAFFSTLTEYYSKNPQPELIACAIDIAQYFSLSPYRSRMPEKFDVMAYLLKNQDIIKNEIDPYKHFLEYGHAENRSYDWAISDQSKN